VFFALSARNFHDDQYATSHSTAFVEMMRAGFFVNILSGVIVVIGAFTFTPLAYTGQLSWEFPPEFEALRNATSTR
jgi:hypothetical protein